MCLCAGTQVVNISLPGDKVPFYVPDHLLISEDCDDSLGAWDIHA